MPQVGAANQASAGGQTRTGFEVRLGNFTGPFDLLLSLISKHELDITEVALATVTDEFIAYIRALQAAGSEWKLDEASEFLVIAATLLDIKAARLLPAGEVADDEDVALLEARDLLFARLLQYRAYKHAAQVIGEALAVEGLRFPRQAGLEERFASLLPELVWRHSPEQFAALAQAALAPKEPEPTVVGLEHLHSAPVSVAEQAEYVLDRLRQQQRISFADLAQNAVSGATVVARFLALLELFRQKLVAFDQSSPLGELTISLAADAEATSVGVDHTELQEVGW
ncbi:segregation and condensation protein A [Pseudarthrobacter sp. J1738]|uniref:segregation and condensation protein A n=1 Tax=unclassified Pseudarthrobacter TaxID=2647000 RepID=UPI003D28F56A